MSTTPGDAGIPLADVFARRGLYFLESRHTGMARPGAAVIAALAIAAVVAPIDGMSAGDRALAVLACAVAIALHALLLWIPGRRPRLLLTAVDVTLIVDAVLIGVLAHLSGGAGSPALWMLPLFCLAATLALSVGQGVKALILSVLVTGAVALAEGHALPDLSLSLGLLTLAAAVVVVAGWATRINERDLVDRRTRLNTIYDASMRFVAADDAEAMARIAEGAGQTLLPGWDVAVTLQEGEARRERGGREDGRAFLALPILARARDDSGDRTLGTITASRPVHASGRPQTVRGQSVEAMRTLAQSLSAALVQQDLRVSLEHMSMSDPLTGLGNRRAFDEALTVEAGRAREAGGSMGLVILDVDHFKQFNDRHGHQAGDDALMSVARVLAQEARGADDRACRIGGEEFALLLPGADNDVAAVVAERVRRAIENSTVAAATITVSLGVAASTGDDPRELLATADARLYVAKAAGRNRVISR